MAHYTVPGCNAESGQTMMLTQFEPIIPQEALMAAGYSLVALGHIHRPQKIMHDWYYSGAINAMNFNDEGQERGFWIHNWNEIGTWQSFFYPTPIREFATIELNNDDITQINMQAIEFVAAEKWKGRIDNKIVRVRYNCTEENRKAYCEKSSNKVIDRRRYDVIWEKYMAEPTLSVKEIATKHTMSKENVYSDLRVAEERMTALIFGVDGLKVR